MKKMMLLGIAAGLLVSASAAFAYPTLAGPTGNAVLPTAAVAAPGEFNAAVDYYNTDDASFPLRLVYGIAPNFEVGAGYAFADADGEDANTWNINAKYATPLTLGDFAWSLGARYSTTDIDLIGGDDATTTSVYFVGTRAFEFEGIPTINGTVGLDWTQIDAEDNNSAFRPFIGADLTLANGLSLAGEFMFKNSDLETDAQYAISARYQIPTMTNLGVQVGFTNADPYTYRTGTDDGNFFAGVNYTFGAAAEE